MLATIQPPATVTPIRQQGSTIAEGLERRAAAIVQLAHSVADANDAGIKAGLPLRLWESDHTMLAGLLPHLDPADARGVLIEATDWIVQSRADGLSDTEIEDLVESAREEARAAVLTDSLAASRYGMNPAPAATTPVPQADAGAVEQPATPAPRESSAVPA